MSRVLPLLVGTLAIWVVAAITLRKDIKTMRTDVNLVILVIGAVSAVIGGLTAIMRYGRVRRQRKRAIQARLDRYCSPFRDAP
jgi:type VI protein secretion system component VasK